MRQKSFIGNFRLDNDMQNLYLWVTFLIEKHYCYSLKRKMKRFEEGFEKDFGYRPSLADKMSNPETKKMCSLLTKLRKEVKSE